MSSVTNRIKTFIRRFLEDPKAAFQAFLSNRFTTTQIEHIPQSDTDLLASIDFDAKEFESKFKAVLVQHLELTTYDKNRLSIKGGKLRCTLNDDAQYEPVFRKFYWLLIKSPKSNHHEIAGEVLKLYSSIVGQSQAREEFFMNMNGHYNAFLERKEMQEALSGNKIAYPKLSLNLLEYGEARYLTSLKNLISQAAQLTNKEKKSFVISYEHIKLESDINKRVEKAIRALFWQALTSPEPSTLLVASHLMTLYKYFADQHDAYQQYYSKMQRQNLGVVELVKKHSNAPQQRMKRASGKLNGGYFVHNCLPFSNGGYAIRTDYIATALNSKGLNLTCFARMGFPKDLSTEHQVSEKELFINGTKYVYNDDFGRNTLSLENYLTKAQEYYFQVIKSYKLDFALAASNYITSLPVLLAAKKANIPFIYDMRGLWEVTRLSREPEFEHSFNYRLQCFAENYVYQHADGMSFISVPLQQYVEKRSGFLRPSNTVITRNSADLFRFINEKKRTSIVLDEEYRKESGDFIFGYIGSFVVYEGLLLLVKAFHLMLTRLEQSEKASVKLLLVGSDNATSSELKGPIFAEIEDYIINNDLQQNIHLTGRVDATLISSTYQFLDCCVLPRISSPVTEIVTPLKPAEALASGIPILCSNVGGLIEMTKDSKQVRYFTAGSDESLCNEMMDILNLDRNDEYFSADSAREYSLTNFDHNISCSDLYDLILDLVVEPTSN